MSLFSAPHDARRDGFLTPISRFRLPLSWVGPLIVFGDCILIILASSAATTFYNHVFLSREGDFKIAAAIGLAVCSYFVLIAAYRRNYELDHLKHIGRQLREVIVFWTLVFLLNLGMAFLLKIGPQISRGAVVVFFLLGGATICLWRGCIAAYLMRVRSTDWFATKSIILITDGATPNLIAESRIGGFHIPKIIRMSGGSTPHQIAQEVLEETIKNPRIEAIFLDISWNSAESIKALTKAMTLVPLSLFLLPDPAIASLGFNPVKHAGGQWRVELRRTPLSAVERCMKRTLDILLSLVLLSALAPFFVLVAILIKLESAGPVIFTQTRHGFNNRAFRIFKFRSLRTVEDGAVIQQVTRDDPRLTRLGRLLRRSSIDELPQLINVLRGEMSIVGPRPHAAAHNLFYAPSIKNYAFRHHVKPGLTGWAQIHGLRGETRTLSSMQQRIDYDTWYINNWSLLLDVEILARTLYVVIIHSFQEV